jgi:hypothetical protein
MYQTTMTLPLTFRDQCALVLLEKYADKMFDKQFIREAWDAGLEPETFLASHIEVVTDSMCRTFPR